MFGKRKNEKDVDETPKNTVPTPSLRDVLEKSNVCSAADAIRLECSNTAGNVALGFAGLGYSPASSYASYAASLSEARTVDMLLDIYKDLAAAVMDVLEPEAAVAQLANVLENIKCPTDDCRACPYYVPGSIEHCDKNRFIAEYLVYKSFVKVNRPKQEEQEEE